MHITRYLFLIIYKYRLFPSFKFNDDMLLTDKIKFNLPALYFDYDLFYLYFSKINFCRLVILAHFPSTDLIDIIFQAL